MDNISPNFRKKKPTSKKKTTNASESDIQLNHFGNPINIHPHMIDDACKTATQSATEQGYTSGDPQYESDMSDIISDVLNEKRKKS